MSLEVAVNMKHSFPILSVDGGLEVQLKIMNVGQKSTYQEGVLVSNLLLLAMSQR